MMDNWRNHERNRWSKWSIWFRPVFYRNNLLKINISQINKIGWRDWKIRTILVQANNAPSNAFIGASLAVNVFVINATNSMILYGDWINTVTQTTNISSSTFSQRMRTNTLSFSLRSEFSNVFVSQFENLLLSQFPGKILAGPLGLGHSQTLSKASAGYSRNCGISDWDKYS